MPLPPVDPETSIINEHYAVVYSPKRARNRFPENCVTLYDDMQSALEHCDSDNKLYAARVVGPSRSSEGFMLYYLKHWLSE